MEEANRARSVAEEIDRYRREMLALYQRNIPAQTEPAPPPPEPAAPEAPLPLPTPALPAEPELPRPPIEESPFVGYLRVFVFTANGAEPLAGARVAVTRRAAEGEVLYANSETDRDGFTPVIPLPSVDPALSLQPGSPQPFIPYDIRVTAEGFRPALHRNVPVYGNNYVTQPVSLVPLLPGENPTDNQLFQSGGPADL